MDCTPGVFNDTAFQASSQLNNRRFRLAPSAKQVGHACSSICLRRCAWEAEDASFDDTCNAQLDGGGVPTGQHSRIGRHFTCLAGGAFLIGAESVFRFSCLCSTNWGSDHCTLNSPIISRNRATCGRCCCLPVLSYFENNSSPSTCIGCRDESVVPPP